MPPPTLLEPPLDETSRRLALVRIMLQRVLPDDGHHDINRRDEVALVKAQAYVLVSAALENYVTAMLDAVMSEISAVNPPQSDLRPTLFAMWSFPVFDALQQLTGLRKWARRADVFPPLFDPTPMAPNAGYNLPLDGRTLRRDHFETIWLVFGFTPPPLPGPLHAMALRDLATGRNNVAHGNTDPVGYGRGKVAADVLRLVDRVEDVVEHLAIAADDYVRNDRFIR